MASKSEDPASSCVASRGDAINKPGLWMQLRVARFKDLSPIAEHRDRNVILLTLASLSQSLTLPVSRDHLIAQSFPETIAA
jgi:hypothetical protein